MKRLPTMKQLEYLTALADTLHFGRAAERCHVTQSTLSAGIRDLESVLGTQVAERSNRRVLITRVGVEIAERAKALLRDAEKDHGRGQHWPLTDDGGDAPGRHPDDRPIFPATHPANAER